MDNNKVESNFKPAACSAADVSKQNCGDQKKSANNNKEKEKLRKSFTIIIL